MFYLIHDTKTRIVCNIAAMLYVKLSFHWFYTWNSMWIKLFDRICSVIILVLNIGIWNVQMMKNAWDHSATNPTMNKVQLTSSSFISWSPNQHSVGVRCSSLITWLYRPPLTELFIYIAQTFLFLHITESVIGQNYHHFSTFHDVTLSKLYVTR